MNCSAVTVGLQQIFQCCFYLKTLMGCKSYVPSFAILMFFFLPWNTTLERLNNLPLNTTKPKFVAIFVFFVEQPHHLLAKQGAILFLLSPQGE